MTTELTKAAQQALACMRGLQQHLGPDICAIEADALERALTQRPAAQTEREAFEAWFDDYYNKACAEFGGIDCTDPKGIAEDAWQAGRASLPAPQQATPDLADGPARMHWTNWMPVKDALEYAYQKMGLEMVKTDAGAKYPNLHWNLAGLVREFVVAQQDAMFGKCQACGKNVGLLDQIKCLDCGTRLCEPCAKEHFGSDHGARAAASHSHPAPTTSGWVETSAPPQRLDWSDTQQATPEPVGEQINRAEVIRLINGLIESDVLPQSKMDLLRELTRPAPGVPEGFALVPMTEDQVWHNDSIMSANGICGLKMHAVMRIVRGVEAHHSERLAAAQAKGGE